MAIWIKVLEEVVLYGIIFTGGSLFFGFIRFLNFGVENWTFIYLSGNLATKAEGQEVPTIEMKISNSGGKKTKQRNYLVKALQNRS